MKVFIRILLIVFVISIIGLIYYVGSKPLNDKEIILLSIILTIISVLATWIASYYYSESNYRTAVKEVEEDHVYKLKTYALKASEKVNNLSTELNKLSLYLQDELECEYDNLPQQNFAREERIKSAIHIIGTLKSVNDTALSDWKGVIGEELEEQEEEKKEREDALYDLIDRYEKLIAEMKDNTFHSIESYQNEDLKSEIRFLKKDLALLINNISGTSSVRSIPIGPKKQDVKSECPICKSPLNYQQRAKNNSIKIIHCKSCDSKLLSRWSKENGFKLSKEVYLNEEIKCPACETKLTVNLSSFPNTSANIKCTNCSSEIRITRRINDILTKTMGAIPIAHILKEETKIEETILKSVKEKLPKQPWPIGIHNSIANELDLSPKDVRLAITELIERGDYYLQHNGKIYSEVKE